MPGGKAEATRFSLAIEKQARISTEANTEAQKTERRFCDKKSTVQIQHALFQAQHMQQERRSMGQNQALTPAKRKRRLKQFGTYPAGYTREELEQFLDLLYGMFSYQYTIAELRQVQLSDPFDRSETPRHMTVVELAEWLEALLA